MDLGLEFQKTNIKIRFNILETLCVPIFRQKGQIFNTNFPKNGIRVANSENLCWNKNQHPQDTLCAKFQAKRTFFTFLVQICPKIDFGVGISKI